MTDAKKLRALARRLHAIEANSDADTTLFRGARLAADAISGDTENALHAHMCEAEAQIYRRHITRRGSVSCPCGPCDNHRAYMRNLALTTQK